MSERALLAAAAALAGLVAGGGIGLCLDFAYGAAHSGRTGAMNRAPTQAVKAGPMSGTPASNATSRSAGVPPAPAPGPNAPSSGAALRPDARQGTRPCPTQSAPSQRGAGILRAHTRRIVLLAVATGMVWAIAALRAIDLRHFLLMAIFGAVLLALATTDFEQHRLPNRLLYPALIAALLLCGAWPGRPFATTLLGGAIGLGVMLTVFLVLPGFGFGDVKLAGLIGLVLGFPGVAAGLLAGAMLGGAGAALLLLTGRARLKTAIAYGPYLAGGAIVEMLLRR